MATKVFLKGLNIIIDGDNDIPRYIPTRAGRMQPHDDNIQIYDIETSETIVIELVDLQDEDGNTFATIEDAEDYLSEFIGGFNNGGGNGIGVDLITNNTGQIKLNWTLANEPQSTPGFSPGVPQQIPLNENYTVSTFPTTTYPHLSNELIGGQNVISPSTLCIRELLAGQIIIFRVKAGYLNKGSGQTGGFTIKMYNPNPSSSFQIIKSIPTPSGITTYEEEFEFIAIADGLSLNPLYGYKFEAQSTFNDNNLTAYIQNITAFYLAVEPFNK